MEEGLFLKISVFAICLTTTWQASENNNDPRGHMLPLGSHRPSEGHIDELHSFPHPADFYQKYVKGSKPVIFKGAAKGIPAYTLWTDKYLSDKYGHLMMECEGGKKENRTGSSMEMTLKKFIQVYKEENIYMVQDVYPEMRVDLSMPRCLQCGGFQDNLDLVVMWYSGGGTKSVLHSDSNDNINCLFEGSKDLKMIDKIHQENIQADHWVDEQGYSEVDIEKVDMYKFPRFRDVPWYSAHMDPGDCLYIPIFWYHQVDSSNTRNLAANLWFTHILWFNQSDCDNMPRELVERQPLHHYDVSMFMGGGPSLEKIRTEVFGPFEDLEKITMEDMREEWDFEDEDLQMLFELGDKNRDMELSWEEVYMIDLLDLLENFPEVLSEEYHEELSQFFEYHRGSSEDDSDDYHDQEHSEL